MNKLEKSFNILKPFFKAQLQSYLDNINHNIKVQNIKNEREAKKDSKDDEKNQSEDLELKVVDSDKIKSIVSLIDEFNNIIAKNYAVYGSYDDFSFANTRSPEKVQDKLQEFFKIHFSGDFQLKNSFEQTVLPRIFYLE